MDRNLLRVFATFTLFGVMMLALVLYAPLASAEGPGESSDDEVTEIDLETDEDGNGIPD